MTSTLTYQVCAQVDTQDGDGSQWQRYIGQDEQQEWGDLRNVAGQGVGNRLLQVVEDQATCRKGELRSFQLSASSGLFVSFGGGHQISLLWMATTAIRCINQAQ